MSAPRVRLAGPADRAGWLEMRCALWPETSRTEHAEEMESLLRGELSPRGAAVFVAEDAVGLTGFVEVSVRPWAEGCRAENVGYLEGWYVAERARRLGVGAALLASAMDWARARGCSEFASDADPQNAVSLAAHRALGFEDVGTAVLFRMDL